MDTYNLNSQDQTVGQVQQQASAQMASAYAAAAGTPSTATSVNNVSAPSNDVSIEAMLSQKMPRHLMDRSAPPSMPSGVGGANQHHPVAEFLYQLTKMLTDDNSEIIEWVDGRIKVHYPERLEDEVLHKYFRHSKFASFQRQLNYFGFRKIAGKGKMSPCSYVNESATSDIRSLLLIKRKTNGSAARKALAQRAMAFGGNLNPALATGLPGIGANGFGALGGAAGLSALTQQLQLQKQLGFIDTTNPLSQLLMQNQQAQSFTDLQQLGGLKPTMPSIEQLQAQLATLTQQQNQGGASAALNAAAFSLASGGATSALGSSHFLSSDNPATAALNASATGPTSMPATAAMNSNSDVQTNNLFESATNLKALIGNDQGGNDAQKAAAAAAGLNRLPSSTGLFPGSISNASLGNLLASSNRLSSLLSLNSFLSREPSLADLAMMPSQFAAFQQHQQLQSAPGMHNDGNNASST
ncbi:HSF-type DNA-binding protein [Nitzschia inconspicua]|uniref:HSF-type DNA-binding protein n=1 Tax=Nitzschia inconspicua TaxID=303405 RepID=A0A9K3LLB6_9STRA|nr:HSF-type DNA-binding protein [Nitzschia inconspicua]